MDRIYKGGVSNLVFEYVAGYGARRQGLGKTLWAVGSDCHDHFG